MLGNLVASVAQPFALAASLYGGVNAVVHEVEIAQAEAPAAAVVSAFDSQQSLDMICATFAGVVPGMPNAGVAACHAATQGSVAAHRTEPTASL